MGTLVETLGSPELDAQAAVLDAEQQRLDEALARGSASYDLLFESLPKGIGAHEIDRNMIVRRVNRNELELLGYTLEEVVGRRIFDFVIMDETSRRAITKKLAGTMNLRPFVRSFRRADGSATTLLLLDRYLRDAGGTILGIRTLLAKAELK